MSDDTPRHARHPLFGHKIPSGKAYSSYILSWDTKFFLT